MTRPCLLSVLRACAGTETRPDPLPAAPGQALPLGQPHPPGTGEVPGGGARKWDPVVSLVLGIRPSPPSAAWGHQVLRPTSPRACTRGLHCRSWAVGGSPCRGYHPPFQLTSAQAPSSRLRWQVTGRHFNRCFGLGWPGQCWWHISGRVAQPFLTLLEHKQEPGLGAGPKRCEPHPAFGSQQSGGGVVPCPGKGGMTWRRTRQPVREGSLEAAASSLGCVLLPLGEAGLQAARNLRGGDTARSSAPS